MITTNDINSILGIKEAFQLHGALKSVLFDKSKREEIFNKFLEIENDLSYDWFTNYFQEEQANRKGMMQDYTPDCICKLLCELNKTNKLDQETVFDCCCGIGGLTISMWQSNKNRTFYLEELSDNSMMMLLFNLSIRGMNAYVRHGDVLTNTFKAYYKVQNDGKFSNVEIIDSMDDDFKVNTVISNPPYSLKFDDVESFKDDKRFIDFGIPPKAKADYAFILHALSHLKENGSMYFILPHGVLFRGGKEEQIRRKLIESNLLDAVIGLPEKLFLNTTIPVCILVLKKNRDKKGVVFIDASKEFVNKGKQNKLSKEHIDKIVSSYNSNNDFLKYSHITNYDEIKNNDFNLNFPRYVDTFEEHEPIDLRATIEEITKLEDEIHDVDMELAKMFDELQGPLEYQKSKLKLIEHLNNRYTHDVSNALRKIYEFINKEAKLKEHKKINLLDLVDIERSKKNKLYPADSILIQLSATRGQMQYMNKSGPADAKYGVMMLKNKDINPRYLYFILNMNMGSFLSVYQTGLNIVPEVFKFMNLEIHTDRQIQDKIADMFDDLENIEVNYQKEIAKWKDIKQFHLDNMFI